MIKKRVDLGMNVDDFHTKTKKQLMKEKEIAEKAKVNEKLWSKFI